MVEFDGDKRYGLIKVGVMGIRADSLEKEEAMRSKWHEYFLSS